MAAPIVEGMLDLPLGCAEVIVEGFPLTDPAREDLTPLKQGAEVLLATALDACPVDLS